MSRCLICHAEILASASWSQLFSLRNEYKTLCEDCNSKFVRITGLICRSCGRPLEHNRPEECYDCVRWNADPNWKEVLKQNRSVFVYNDFMKETLALFKFRGDYAIGETFKQDMLNCLKQHFNSDYTIIPIPLSKERLYERGFNQARALAELLNMPIIEPLERIHTEKQSKKTRTERIHSQNVFTAIIPNTLENKQILLIDDIYTTGTTLRQAAKVLLDAGASSVSSLTLARG